MVCMQESFTAFPITFPSKRARRWEFRTQPLTGHSSSAVMHDEENSYLFMAQLGE